MVVTSLFPKKQTCSGGSETIDGRRSLEFRGSRKQQSLIIDIIEDQK